MRNKILRAFWLGSLCLSVSLNFGCGKSSSAPAGSSVGSQVASALASNLNQALVADGISQSDANAISSAGSKSAQAGVILTGLEVQGASTNSAQAQAFQNFLSGVAQTVPTLTDLTPTQQLQVIKEAGAGGTQVLQSQFPSPAGNADSDQQLFVTATFSAFSAAGIPPQSVEQNMQTLAQAFMGNTIKSGVSPSALGPAAQNFSTAMAAAFTAAGIPAANVQSDMNHFVGGLSTAATQAQLPAAQAGPFQAGITQGAVAAANAFPGVGSSATNLAAALETVKSSLQSNFGSGFDPNSFNSGFLSGANAAGIPSSILNTAQSSIQGFNPLAAQPPSFQPSGMPAFTPPIAPSGVAATGGFIGVTTAYVQGTNLIMLSTVGKATCTTSTCSGTITFVNQQGTTIATATFTSTDVTTGSINEPVALTAVTTMFVIKVTETLDGGSSVTLPPIPGFNLTSAPSGIPLGATPPPLAGGQTYTPTPGQGVPTPPPMTLPSGPPPSGPPPSGGAGQAPNSGPGAVTVTGVTPTTLSVAGGTALTITGTGFATGDIVGLGGAQCGKVVVVSSTQITCTAPAHVAGAVQLMVGNPATNAGGMLPPNVQGPVYQ